MSVSEKTARGFKIEASELFRVFKKRSENTEIEQTETTSKTIENSTLQAKLDAAQQRYGDAEKTIEDLRERLSKSDDERTRLTTLLTDQRGTPSEPRRWFWQR
jgi:predicted  nucleic acid-binding Zn-ribbon protein